MAVPNEKKYLGYFLSNNDNSWWWLDDICPLLAYLGIYLSLEAAFYPNNPTEFPATPLRTTLAVILFVLHVVIRFTKTKDIMKAALGVPPVGIMVIGIDLRFYDRVFFSLSLSVSSVRRGLLS
ncbi:MAG: hypothetical protein WC968_03885 [Bacilli bacterium]|jgi:hypothetical protein